MLYFIYNKEEKIKKGFTLVELLAVIVILAIILAIAIPSITGIIENQRKSAFESNIKMIIKGIEYEMLENPSFDPTSLTYPADLDTYGGDPNQFTMFIITLNSGVIKIDADAKDGGKFSGLCVKDATFNVVNAQETPCEAD